MSSVPGGADLERRNQYWIDLGVSRERERIIALLGDDAEIWHSENLQADLIALIKGEN